MTAAERWHGRALTLEAGAMLAVARLLIAALAFRRWRALLGRPVATEPGDPALNLAHNREPRRLARAVERAALRLPGESLCLSQAMALTWMLRRRGFACTLVLGVLPGARCGTLDDLHAWVIREGEIVIGEATGGHRPIVAFVGAQGGPFSNDKA